MGDDRSHDQRQKDGFTPFIEAVESFPKPLVAAVNGIGVGIGMTILPHCDLVLIELNPDGSVSVEDNGRGIPVGMHKGEGVSAAEVIMTQLHAGGKFDQNSYKVSGGLHGVGVSVVNALSAWLEVEIKRDGKLHYQKYKKGKPVAKLKPVDTVGKRNTGSCVRFKPEASYFDSPNVSIPDLKHLLRAKAVLCPNLRVSLTVEGKQDETESWFYEDGLKGYLQSALAGAELVPAEPFMHSAQGNQEAVDWALQWITDGGDGVSESHVNLRYTDFSDRKIN